MTKLLSAISSDPVSVGIALAAAGLIGGAFFSWLFTFYYFKKAQSRKLVCFTTTSYNFLGYRRSEFHDLSISYGGRHLTDPARYTIYFWNCGTLTINGSDVSATDPISFGRNDIEILEVASMWSTRASISPTITLEASKNKLILGFDFLDPDDGVAIQFLADRSLKDPWLDNLEVYGTIKGLHRAPFHVAAEFDKSNWWTPYIACAALVFFAFSTGSMAYDAWLSGLGITSLIKVLATIFFAIATIIATMRFFATLSSFRSLTVPDLLRRQGASANLTDDTGSRAELAELNARIEYQKDRIEQIRSKQA